MIEVPAIVKIKSQIRLYGNRHKMTPPQNNNFSMIFHMDFNHVSLRKEYICRWLERLSDMGYNAILWEIEDKVQLETCSDVIWPEALSKNEFRSILNYSRKLGLEPIPLLQTIGHAEYILKHDAYCHMRELKNRHDCYCTSNLDVRSFLKNMAEEYLDMFGDIQHFHIGGDEAYIFASCPKCKAAAERLNSNSLYAEHIIDIAQPIIARGVRPGIWSDMMLSHPENIEYIPKNLAIWDWNYWDGDINPEAVMVWGRGRITKEQVSEVEKKTLPEIMDSEGNLRSFYTTDVLRRLGYDVFICSSTRSFGDTVFCGSHDIHSHNVIGAAQKGRRSGLMGHCVTSWAVRIFNLDIQEAWLAMASECSTSPETQYEDITFQVGEKIFGINPKEFYDAIEKVATKIPFAVSGHDSGVQWSGLKDSLPAPANHIKSIFEKWKNEDNGKRYEEKKQELKEALLKIPQGQAKLENFTEQVTTSRGKNFCKQWLIAAKFQMRTAKMVERAFKRFENGFDKIDQQGYNEIMRIRKDFENWLLYWMTPQSAKLNSELVFNPLAEWFKTTPNLHP